MSSEVLGNVFRKALLARRFEERIMKLCLEGFIPPMLHPGAGHEVAQVAALTALEPDDPVLYSHRGLAYMVARGVSLSAMLCDMAGRQGGTNNGKGGIMHVVDVERGIYGESGTLGGGLVISVGIGMALKKKHAHKVVIHFFGDGGSNRGTFHEALNWASVQKLPCVYVCENNGWAVSVPTHESTAVANIADRAAGYGIPGVIVDGGDPQAVFNAVRTAAKRARSGLGPSLIEIKATRLLGHYATDPQDYRSDANAVLAKDPLTALRSRIVSERLMTHTDLDALEKEITTRIEQAVETARAAPVLAANLAFTDLYSAGRTH